jgi:hypothetical protein
MNRELNLLCAECGDRIGVYERFWMRNADGTVVSSRDADAVQDGARPIHDACLNAAQASAA